MEFVCHVVVLQWLLCLVGINTIIRDQLMGRGWICATQPASRCRGEMLMDGFVIHRDGLLPSSNIFAIISIISQCKSMYTEIHTYVCDGWHDRSLRALIRALIHLDVSILYYGDSRLCMCQVDTSSILCNTEYYKHAR